MNYHSLISLAALREWNKDRLRERSQHENEGQCVTEKTEERRGIDEDDREFVRASELFADYRERMGED